MAAFLLVAFGLSGLATVIPGLATAMGDGQGRHEDFEDADEAHGFMHDMMGGIHGEETVEAMHQVEGSEKMMDHCASMMVGMGGMDGRMMRQMDGRGESMMSH